MIFSIKPVFTINCILNLFVEQTIALGGVEIGIIYAQLAANMIGIVICTTFIFDSTANDANNGKNKNVVAVLLVNSVIIEVKNVKARIKTITS